MKEDRDLAAIRSKELLTLEEFGLLFGVSARSISREVAAGRIRTVKVRRLRRIPNSQIEQYRRLLER